MSEIPLWILLAAIAFLVLMSAFFSGSETSMMAINRYRLKHLVKEKNKSAKRVAKLIERTDRLLGVILIGNNFTHTLSTALATVVAIRIWSDSAVLAVTVFMTIIMIIFAEVMPKTIAALKPESLAFPSSYLLKPLSKVLSPLITLVSFVSNGVTKLIGIDLDSVDKDELRPEELRTLLQTSGVPKRQEEMLMGIFDMDYLSVNDVMIPKNEIVGIDLNDYLLPEVQTPPLPPQPMPNAQVLQKQGPGGTMYQGLTPAENAYLSEEEKMIRLRDRGLV